MSVDNPDRSQSEVQDEEGTVDRKIKNRILDARARVDEREDILFTQPIVDPELNLNRVDATRAWGNTVRQFIRSIEPLLRSDDIKNSEYYYAEVILGRETLVPPDSDKYQFSKFANEEISDKHLKRDMGLPPSFEPPEPVTVEFTGLGDILRQEMLHHKWTVDVADKGRPAIKELSVETPVPKFVYENAVRAADQFLQQAGVGMDISSGRQLSDYSD